MHRNPAVTAESLNARSPGYLPGLIGLNIKRVADGEIDGEFAVRRELLAPNDFLHAASVIALADTLAGYGCVAHLPAGASGFTTIELKSNFLGTAREGHVDCSARAAHLGRTTQVWDATATHRETGRAIALFRCTQMVLWPKASA
ncbi:MAG TPA: PaaI family thioesterase [Burkholderiales bacterium]|jgi:uncharacterized protein (TIGR00369 family)|nr:PaaI family thioesterase [Burkholderiales bacterium]